MDSFGSAQKVPSLSFRESVPKITSAVFFAIPIGSQTTVEILGIMKLVSGMPSNPVTATSCGTRMPCLFSTLHTANAILSLAHIIASGIFPEAIIFSVSFSAIRE